MRSSRRASWTAGALARGSRPSLPSATAYGHGQRRRRDTAVGRSPGNRPTPLRKWSAVEGVLDVVARILELLAPLLEVRRGLVALALGFESLVVGDLSGGFLGLALEVLTHVVGLVFGTHVRAPFASDRIPVPLPGRTRSPP